TQPYNRGELRGTERNGTRARASDDSQQALGWPAERALGSPLAALGDAIRGGAGPPSRGRTALSGAPCGRPNRPRTATPNHGSEGLDGSLSKALASSTWAAIRAASVCPETAEAAPRA